MHFNLNTAEVGGVTFSDSTPLLFWKFRILFFASVLKFSNSDPDSNFFSNSRSRLLFRRRKPSLEPKSTSWPKPFSVYRPCRLLLLPKTKSDSGSGPVFSKTFDSGLRSAKAQNLAGVNLRVSGHLWMIALMGGWNETQPEDHVAVQYEDHDSSFNLGCSSNTMTRSHITQGSCSRQVKSTKQMLPPHRVLASRDHSCCEQELECDTQAFYMKMKRADQ